MAPLIQTYPTEDAARRAVETLLVMGLQPRDIRLLTSRPLRDTRREPVGGFAGPIGTDAAIGTYASVARRRGQGTGSFAGDLRYRGKGSFADVERVVIVIWNDDGEHSRVTGYRGVRQLLRRAGLDDDAVDRALKDLHVWHAVVLVEAAEVAATAVRERLEQVARAA